MLLDERKLKILQAIIDDYILTATPVGSRTISKQFPLSPATIRNEMSDLEYLGYLEQPHTSAGRIPSDKAYRLYVDKLMRTSNLSHEEMRKIRLHYTRVIDEVEDIIKETGRVLADMTNYISIVLEPQVHKTELKHIQLVPVTCGRALAVIVTDTGIVRDTMLRIPDNFSERQLEKISEMLMKRFRGRSFDDISSSLMSDLDKELGAHKSFFDALMDVIGKSIAPADGRGISLSGTTNILSFPEYSDVNKARYFLEMLESKDMLFDILSRASQMEYSITIGNENEPEGLKNSSLVTVTYRIGNRPIGSFGVIGPTRMNYPRVLAVLDYLGKNLTQVLSDAIDDNDPNDF